MWRAARALAGLNLTLSASQAFAVPPPIVRVYVAGAPEAVAESRDAILDLCSRSNVAVVVRDAAGADEALLAAQPAPGLAEAYVDLRAGTPVRVVVVDGESRQDLERRTLPDGASLEVSIETVARVVCSAVQSTLDARAAAASRPPISIRVSGTARGVSTGSPWHPRASLFGAAEDFGAGFHGGGGGALGVAYGRSTLRAGVDVAALGYASADVEAERALAEFGLVGLRLMPTLEWRAANRLTPFVAVGGGADFLRVAADRPPLGGAPIAVDASTEVVGSAMVGTRVRLASNLSALLALDLDVGLTRHRYVIAAAGGNRSFFDPARLRGVGLLGLSLSFGHADERGRAGQREAR